MSTALEADPPFAVDPHEPVLEANGVFKSFGHVEALSGVNLRIARGEVVALVGDNGAGKSTFIKTISGAQPADQGTFKFEGRTVQLRSPHDSASLGIAMVYQDLAVADNLDVAANLFLGRERTRMGALKSLDQVSMYSEARRLLDIMGVTTLKSLRTEVGSLSGGQRQCIAIARAMIGDPKLVILDEPTAALGVTQTAQVLDLIRRLKASGHSVILITHNLSDAFSVCDRITVLRHGRNGGDFPALPEYQDQVVAAITGVLKQNPAGTSAADDAHEETKP